MGGALRTLLGVRGGGSRRNPLGPAGERAAARWLRRRGYKVLEKNAEVGVGEADLVCLAPDRRTIVVVEVKTRKSASGGRTPEAAVGVRKKAKLALVTKTLARRRGWEDRPLRIDVIAVEWPERGRPAIRHYESAVGA